MTLRLFLFPCCFLVVTPAFGQAQPVQEVSLCQLRQNAREFDHKLVKVRGTVDFEFEDFTLYDPQCKDAKATPVWLTFGGDVSDMLRTVVAIIHGCRGTICKLTGGLFCS